MVKNHFGAPLSKKSTPISNAGYDNPRENIDPHVRTRVLDTKEANISGNLIFRGPGAGLQYGCIFYHDGGFDTVLAAQDTWYKIVGFDSDGASNGVIIDHVNNHLLINIAGDYEVFVGASARSGASNKFQLAVFKNNGAVELPIDLHITTDVANKVDTASMRCFTALNANDTIEVWVKRTDGGAVSKTITTEHIALNLIQIGG
ncbi:hypothetical protein KAR91_46850 [Candidatus Pacearchaeota archaeon]|nr:hypothetical protein [Candidatus Pacearchaeota archaeon]